MLDKQVSHLSADQSIFGRFVKDSLFKADRARFVYNYRWIEMETGMKCIILAAGYATRLYPLTENFPKPLLDVQGKSILKWLVEDVETVSQIDEIIVVSNHKFCEQFMTWKDTLKTRLPITIIDDGSTTNDDRLGAVSDIGFAIEKCCIDDDILVMAGDNLLDFSIKGFVDFYNEKKAACVMRHYEPSVEKLRRTGVAIVDDNSKVLQMQEKPRNPRSNWAVPPFYIYPRRDLKYILESITSEACGTDSPGSFIAWFCQKAEIYAYLMPGNRYDIGNMESYEKIQSMYKN